MRKYQRYMRSNISHIADVPEHWDICRADAVLETSRAIIDAKELKAQTVFHYSIPIVQETGDGQIEDGSEIDSSKIVVSERQVLVSKLNPRKGTVCVADTHGSTLTVCSSEFVPLIPRHVQLEYLNYLVRSQEYGDRLSSLVESATRSHQRVAPSDIVKFHWAFPPLAEQTVIAAFLDRETAKIDALIAEQERLMELLKEKRQAVISHAVTKGLNPDAPMKDSGVEWLGEVPAHWSVEPIKRHIETTSGGTPNTSMTERYYAAEDAGFPWVRTTDLSNAPLSVAPVRITAEAIQDTACKLLPPGTVMVAMYGGDGTVGKNGILAIEATINQAICGLLPSSQFLSEFTFRYIQFYRPYWMIGAESSRKDPNISQDLVRNTPILRPPMQEQEHIAAYLRGSLERFDELFRQAEESVELLQERRTALISAAVTGQIDVRHLANADAA